MRSRIPLAAALLTLGLALTGCASGSPSTGNGTNTNQSSTGNALAVATTKLGPIVVDKNGRTLYFYDKDTPNSGSSACTGACASIWPAASTSSSTPQVDAAITGTVGTITGVNGKMQLTLNGLPLYTFASDPGPGSTTGQGYDKIWWVVSPNGEKVTTSTGGSGGSGGSYGY